MPTRLGKRTAFQSGCDARVCPVYYAFLKDLAVLQKEKMTLYGQILHGVYMARLGSSLEFALQRNKKKDLT